MRNTKDSLQRIAKVLRGHLFVVPRLLANKHMQMLLSFITPYYHGNIAKQERRYIKLSDGSQLVADCFFQQKKEAHPTIVVINGFEGYVGSGASRFSEGISYKAYHFGFNVIHLKQRGEGDAIHLTHSLFAADPVPDMEAAFVQFINWGLHRFFLIGLSGGGWAALFAAAKLPARIQSKIAGIVSISPPINHLDTLAHAAQHPLYSWLLLQVYKNLVRRRAKIDPPGTWDMKQLRAIKTVRQWGETYLRRIVSDLSEQVSAVDEYHRKTDLTPLLPKGTIPTLIIHAKDDPITPHGSFTTLSNPFILTLFPNDGAHGAFISAKKLYGDIDRHWAQNRAMEFISLLEQ